MSLAAERLVLFLWRCVFLVLVRVELQVDFLAWLNVEKCERGTTLVDESENRSVGRIVEAVQCSVVDAEAVLPEVKCAGDARQGGASV